MPENNLPEEIKPGAEIEVQLSPRGEYPQIVDGENVTQIVDDAAIDALVQNFKDKVLVDADHESETGKGTKAEAWVTRVFKDPERGLVGVFEFTDVGADDVNNKRYRFISPAWTLDQDGRPKELVSVGMTNKPNLPVAPVLNMRMPEGAAAAVADSAAKDPEEQAANAAETPDAPDEGVEGADGNPPPTGTEQGGPAMDKLKEILGLAPEATDEDVATAVQALVEKCNGTAEIANALGLDPETATNEQMLEAVNAVVEQCGQFQDEAKNAEADGFVAENADMAETPEEQADLKEQYLADPEATKNAVANARRIAQKVIANAKAKAKAAGAAQAVINAKAARTPEPVVVNSDLNARLATCNGDPAKENEMLLHGQF